VRRVHVLLAVTLLGACESGSKFPPATLSIDDFCARWSVAVAAAFERCAGTPASAVDASFCARAMTSHAAGRLVYDPGRAPACVHDWQTAGCDQVLTTDLPGCDDVFDGLVPKGGACFDSDECQGNAACVETGLPNCGGVCRALVGVGGACTEDTGGCFGLETCVQGATGPVCAAPGKLGEPCGGGVGCWSGLSCGTDASGQSTCAATRHLGESCDPLGAPCDGFELCAAGVCVARPTVGQPCDGGTTECLWSWCDAAPGATGTCRALLDDGVACAVNDQCAGSLLCVNGACAPPTCPAASSN
jgi:hypothetical protein